MRASSSTSSYTLLRIWRCRSPAADLSPTTTYLTPVGEQATTLLHDTTGMWLKPVFRLTDMAGRYRCIADTRWQITNGSYFGIDRF